MKRDVELLIVTEEHTTETAREAYEQYLIRKGNKARSRQRALLFYWKKEEWPHVREALTRWRRTDLIGRGPDYLVPPGPAFGAWRNYKKTVRYDTTMGMKVERAPKHEEKEENWEALAAG